jgi:TonB family protein
MIINKETGSVPNLETENETNQVKKSILCSLLVSLGLFFLLPLSEFVSNEEWTVRKIESYSIKTPPPQKTELEKQLDELIKKEPPPPILERESIVLDIESLSANLEMGPGDFKAQFSLANFNPISDQGLGAELVFALHELDQQPNLLKRGLLRYPPLLKRKGVEGEVKLLIQIDEKGVVEVLQVVSFTHPDFVEPSKKAAESSLYESPTKNGESVKVQFYLPVRYNILDQ